MKQLLLLSLLFTGLLVAGCGGSSGAKLAATDVAVVGGHHVTVDMFQSALRQAQASAKASGQTLPAAGSSQYAALRTNIVNGLVQQAEFQTEAEKRGIVVSDKEVQAQIDIIKKKYFGGSDKRYLASLKQQGFTDADLRSSFKERLLEQKLYKAVTKDATATDSEIKAYYELNKSQFQQPASRDVQEILVGKNKETLAQQIYAQLKAGTSTFAALAKKYSQDPGSKNIGGKFTAKQGSDVPEFDKAVFDPKSKTGVLLQPVNTAQYGWFVIEPLKPIVPARTTSEAKAAPAIRTQLEGTKKQKVASDWADGVAKHYCSGGRIRYQAGYEPSPDPCAAIKAGDVTTT